MLDKIKIFSAEQAEELKQLKERKAALVNRGREIENGREGLASKLRLQLRQYVDSIQNIDMTLDPENYRYIKDDAERTAQLERKAQLELECAPVKTELEVLIQEYEQIKVNLAELEAETAPFEVLQDFQNKLNENWPMIIAFESVLNSTTEIAPDLIVAVIAPLFDAYMDCVDKMDPQLTRKRKQNAKAFKADYDAFMEAGFTSSQAMDIVLARVKANNLTALLNSVSASKK